MNVLISIKLLIQRMCRKSFWVLYQGAHISCAVVSLLIMSLDHTLNIRTHQQIRTSQGSARTMLGRKLFPGNFLVFIKKKCFLFFLERLTVCDLKVHNRKIYYEPPFRLEMSCQMFFFSFLLCRFYGKNAFWAEWGFQLQYLEVPLEKVTAPTCCNYPVLIVHSLAEHTKLNHFLKLFIHISISIYS